MPIKAHVIQYIVNNSYCTHFQCCKRTQSTTHRVLAYKYQLMYDQKYLPHHNCTPLYRDLITDAFSSWPPAHRGGAQRAAGGRGRGGGRGRWSGGGGRGRGKRSGKRVRGRRSSGRGWGRGSGRGLNEYPERLDAGGTRGTAVRIGREISLHCCTVRRVWSLLVSLAFAQALRGVRVSSAPRHLDP
jgi:hypothetical protein